jgi:hypothetical protein
VAAVVLALGSDAPKAAHVPRRERGHGP